MRRLRRGLTALAVPARLLLVLATLVLAGPFNTVTDTVGAILGGLGGIANAVRDAIARAVAAVWDAVQAAADALWHGVGDVWNFIWSLSQHVEDVLHLLYSVSDSVWRGIRDAGDNLVRFVVSHVADVVGGLASFVNHAVDTLWQGIRDAVASVTSWVLANVWAPVKGLVDTVLNAARDAVEFVAHYGAALARFVEHWLDKIVRFLSDPIGYVQSWVLRTFTASPSTAAGLVTNAVNGSAGTIADWLERWLAP